MLLKSNRCYARINQDSQKPKAIAFHLYVRLDVRYPAFTERDRGSGILR